MPDTLLHWHCGGTTYSVKRATADTAVLIITSPDGRERHGRRPIPITLIGTWKALPVEERCVHAEHEVERRTQPRPA